MIAPQAVRVLQTSILNNPDHRSLGWLKQGQLVTIAGGEYADWLRDEGIVEFVSERELIESQLDELADQLSVAESFSGEEIEEVVEDDGNSEGQEEEEAVEDVMPDPIQPDAPPVETVTTPIIRQRSTRKLRG
jgi:hypothetical protein